MTKFVSAAEANRHFSKLLREASAGERVVVTSRGKPVAEIVPFSQKDERSEEQRVADFRAFLKRLAEKPALNLPKATRDEMYE